jgi:GNAT superfamily N-acetyltransferase/SAM-dependent methyltransferase
MPKRFLKAVALLLIPCLLVEPVCAVSSSISESFSPSPRHRVSPSDLFSRQATVTFLNHFLTPFYPGPRVREIQDIDTSAVRRQRELTVYYEALKRRADEVEAAVRRGDIRSVSWVGSWEETQKAMNHSAPPGDDRVSEVIWAHIHLDESEDKEVGDPLIYYLRAIGLVLTERGATEAEREDLSQRIERYNALVQDGVVTSVSGWMSRSYLLVSNLVPFIRDSAIYITYAKALSTWAATDPEILLFDVFMSALHDQPHYGIYGNDASTDLIVRLPNLHLILPWVQEAERRGFRRSLDADAAMALVLQVFAFRGFIDSRPWGAEKGIAHEFRQWVFANRLFLSRLFDRQVAIQRLRPGFSPLGLRLTFHHHFARYFSGAKTFFIPVVQVLMHPEKFPALSLYIQKKLKDSFIANVIEYNDDYVEELAQTADRLRAMKAPELDPPHLSSEDGFAWGETALGTAVLAGLLMVTHPWWSQFFGWFDPNSRPDVLGAQLPMWGNLIGWFWTSVLRWHYGPPVDLDDDHPVMRVIQDPWLPAAKKFIASGPKTVTIPGLNRELYYSGDLVQPTNPFTENFLRFFSRSGERFKWKRVLDIGTGPGVLAIDLGRKGVTVLATDNVASALVATRANLEDESPDVRRRVSLLESDLYQQVSTYDLAEGFDAVVFNHGPFSYDFPSKGNVVGASNACCGENFQVLRDALAGLPMILPRGGSGFFWGLDLEGPVDPRNVLVQNIWTTEKLKGAVPPGWEAVPAEPLTQTPWQAEDLRGLITIYEVRPMRALQTAVSRELRAGRIVKISQGTEKTVYAAERWVVKRLRSRRQFLSDRVVVRLSEKIEKIEKLSRDSSIRKYAKRFFSIRQRAIAKRMYLGGLTGVRRLAYVLSWFIPTFLLRKVKRLQIYDGILETNKRGDAVVARQLTGTGLIPRRIAIPATRIWSLSWPWTWKVTEVEERAEMDLRQKLEEVSLDEAHVWLDRFHRTLLQLWSKGVFPHDFQLSHFGVIGERLVFLDNGSALDDPALIKSALLESSSSGRVKKRLARMEIHLQDLLGERNPLIPRFMKRLRASLTVENVQARWPDPTDVRWGPPAASALEFKYYSQLTPDEKADPRLQALAEAYWPEGDARLWDAQPVFDRRPSKGSPMDQIDALVAYRRGTSLPVGVQAFSVRRLEPVVISEGLYVHPDYRRQGVGTALRKGLLNILKDRGYRALIVSSDPTEGAEGFQRAWLGQPGTFSFGDYAMMIDLLGQPISPRLEETLSPNRLAVLREMDTLFTQIARREIAHPQESLIQAVQLIQQEQWPIEIRWLIQRLDQMLIDRMGPEKEGKEALARWRDAVTSEVLYVPPRMYPRPEPEARKYARRDGFLLGELFVGMSVLSLMVAGGSILGSIFVYPLVVMVSAGLLAGVMMGRFSEAFTRLRLFSLMLILPGTRPLIKVVGTSWWARTSQFSQIMPLVIQRIDKALTLMSWEEEPIGSFSDLLRSYRGVLLSLFLNRLYVRTQHISRARYLHPWLHIAREREWISSFFFAFLTGSDDFLDIRKDPSRDLNVRYGSRDRQGQVVPIGFSRNIFDVLAYLERDGFLVLSGREERLLEGLSRGHIELFLATSSGTRQIPWEEAKAVSGGSSQMETGIFPPGSILEFRSKDAPEDLRDGIIRSPSRRLGFGQGQTHDQHSIQRRLQAAA